MDQNSTEISPEHQTPSTDEVQRMIELAFFQHEHANISRDRRIAALEAENTTFAASWACTPCSNAAKFRRCRT